MNNDNVFDIIIYFVFAALIPQLGLLRPKYQYLVISFPLGEGETITQFHIKALQIINEIFLLQYETGKIDNLTGKYIIELSKLKHPQQ